MEFLIIIWAITAGACWFASLKAAYHYGQAKQARVFLKDLEMWKKRMSKKNEETEGKKR